MTFYTSIILLTELLMIAMTIHVLHYSGFTKVQKTWYLLTFIDVMLCAAAECAAHSGWVDPKHTAFLTVLTVIQFSCAPLLGILFTGSLGLHHQKKIAVGFFVLNLLIETALAPFGLVFRYTPEGYFRGDLFIVYEAFYFLSLIYLIVGMCIVGKRFRHRDFGTIAMIVVVIVAGIVPMTVWRLNVTYVAIAIAASLCYIYYNDLVQQDIKQDLVENQKKISSMQEHIISGMANLIEHRDLETGEHVSRTSDYVRRLAENARKEGVYADAIDDRFISLLCTLAPMHDIGKIIVSDRILRKPGKLDTAEFEEMKKHAAVGGTVVREALNGVTDEEYLSFASDIATYHHERWDGTGYPKGLKGEEIPLSARIMAIADVYEALISVRCYKNAIPPDEAFAIIREESGSHFDPNLAEVFLNHRDEFRPPETV
jgi:HD-GYP domain-containing protein (c-di-GMP phosphodiesterase class II)